MSTMSSTRENSIATSVDTLVYQLEDDKPMVRWNSLQKLRKIAAVETTRFPVRNTRRFLQCVRRRIIGESDRRVAIEALRLVGDVMTSLEDNVDQILSSILPHLISLLPKARKNQEHVEDSDDTEFDLLHEEIVQIFRKYTIVTNNLQAAADLLVNIGLGSSQGSVREASLVVLMRLLDERFPKRSINREDCDKCAIGRGDKALIIALVQAIIPALEDTNENVVVAAEEAIAKLESYWGSRFSADIMKFLSTIDKRTLQEHQEPINEFLLVCTDSTISHISATQSSQPSLNASPSTSTNLRPSLSLKALDGLYFGFLETSIVTTLTTQVDNSNANWKKRTVAVEQLYAACKDVDADTLCGVSAEERGSRMDDLETLFDILVRLTQDVDVHLVKRALQITQIMFRKLIPLQQFEMERTQLDINDERNGRLKKQKHASFYMTKMLVPIVVTAANFAGDDHEMESFVYALLGQIFASALLSVASVEQILASTLFRQRRFQVREEAVKVWLVLLLTAERERLIPANYAPHEVVVQALGRLLGDTSARVRDVAFEVVAVLTMVCRCNIYALLEICMDDEYVSERVDWAALRARLWQKHVPELQSNYMLQFKQAATVKSENGRPLDRIASRVEQSLDNVSELRMMEMHEEPKSSGFSLQEMKDALVAEENVGECNYLQETTDCARSRPLTVDIDDKLSALRKKISHFHQPRPKRLRHPDDKAKTAVNLERSSSTYIETTQLHARSKSSPEQSAYNLDNDVDFLSKDRTSSQSLRDKRVHPSNSALTSATSEKCAFLQPTQLSSQLSQNDKKEGLSCTDRRLLKSIFLKDRVAQTDTLPQSPDERPIRPMNISGDPDITIVNQEKLGEQEAGSVILKNDCERVVSQATRKRLMAKSKLNSPSPLDPQHQSNGSISSDQSPRSSTKQEPRYLEPHEITPLTNPKQELSEVLLQLRSDDWETNFDALSMVRRLAVHHSNIVDANKVHAIVAEIMKQMMNLRSSVSKNALLALDSMCATFSRDIDMEVEKLVPLLLKRCADSNSFVSESAITTLNTMVLKCSLVRVVAALGCHVNSKAVPIRREVARALHALIMSQAGTNPTTKDLSLILQLVGQGLADSHNEVRDIAKQTILHLHYSERMSGERIKRFLPALAKTKVDSVLQGKVVYSPPVPKFSSMSEIVTDLPTHCDASKKHEIIVAAARTRRVSQHESGASPPTSSNESRIKINPDELVQFETKLGSSNWKDRFDALQETTDYICSCATALVESGQMLNLFDQLIKRLDDGNAKVNVLALECMEKIVPAVGSGMEQVLPNFVPAITKNLANARTSTLAQSVLQKLCAHADHRSLCQQLALQARNANSRVLPLLLDTLTELTAQSVDEKSNYILTRNVLPLALNLLKEAKSSVKDANTRLLRQLQGTLGLAAVLSAASKLSTAQQDKLASVLR